jgi:hypothetical protein
LIVLRLNGSVFLLLITTLIFQSWGLSIETIAGTAATLYSCVAVVVVVVVVVIVVIVVLWTGSFRFCFSASTVQYST